MSSDAPAPLPAAAPADCPHCLKAPQCSASAISVTPFDNRVELLILQHPQEQDRALGSARLAALHFKNAMFKIGLSWPSLSKIVGREADPKAWAILYLGSSKAETLGARPRHRGGEPQGRGAARPGSGAARHRGHHPARRHLEPGQGDVVAQRLDAQVPPRAARARAAVALRQAAQGAAPRRALHHRGRRHAAGAAGEEPEDRGRAQHQLRQDAGALPRGASAGQEEVSSAKS